MRLILVTIATFWGIGAVFAIATTANRSSEAKIAAAYFGLWPAAALLVFVNQPVPLWIALPVITGFIPWFMSGPYLWMSLRKPEPTQPGQIIGIPTAYWKWGILAAITLGALGDLFLRP